MRREHIRIIFKEKMQHRFLCIVLLFFSFANKGFTQCAYQRSASITHVTCLGGNNGAIYPDIDGDTADISNPGVLISEIFTDPSGNDSPFEWVELVATKALNFSLTPYTVIVSNNGFASSKGWIQGGAPSPPPNNSTYAFQIDSGIVVAGDVFYVGGVNMAVSGVKIRVKQTAIEPGDGGIGAPFLSTGVIGNGGGVADGVAIFNKSTQLIDSTSIPVDAIFFGAGIGSAATADTSKGFTLPTNDNYGGGHLKLNSYCAPDVLGKYSVKATGRYNSSNGTFSSPRGWSSMGVAGPTGISDVKVDRLEYNWSTGATTKSIQNLTAGTYTLIITSQSLYPCVQTYSYNVGTSGPSVNISFSTNQPTCSTSNNGVIYASVSGLNPYSTHYSWSNGESGINKNSISNLAPGNYSVTVSDGQSACSYSQSVILSDRNQYPITNAISYSTICPGSQNGYAVGQITQQTAVPYSFLWSNGETGQDISQVPSGTYTLTVTDGLGCTYVDTANVLEEIAVSIDSVTPDSRTVGYPVTLYGENFSMITEVYFGSLKAPFTTLISDSVLSVVIPERADTGNVRVRTKNNCWVEGPIYQPVDAYGRLSIKVFYEGLYLYGGYMNSPLINSGLSGNALSTDLIQIELISVSDLNKILFFSACTLNTEGITEVKFPYDLIGEGAYIKIKGRNMVETWSKTPVILGEFCSYDFSSTGCLQGIKTLAIDSIQYTSSRVSIQVISPVCDSIIAVGVCWNIESDPIVELNQNTSSPWYGDTLPISFDLNQLQTGIKYFARAFVSTSKGIIYGNTLSFTTPFILMDADGNIYDTIRIGNQTWMKQNLAVTRYRNGQLIPHITGNQDWFYAHAYQKGAWTYYDTLPSNNIPYGKLYNYYTVNDTAICPTGWHIPSSSEWNELISFLGGTWQAGNALRDTGTLYWNFPNSGATNSSGFSALPGGIRNVWNGFGQKGNWAVFRSSDGPSLVVPSPNYSPYVWFEQDQSRGESIRCIKDRLPSVYTSEVLSRSSNRLFVGGTVGYVDGIQNFTRGICWSTSPQPNISMPTKVYSGAGHGEFKVSIPNLAPSTTYYYRAFSSDGVNVVYGDVKQGQTTAAPLPGQIVDVDGFAYDTVQIGSQTWLKQNLRTSRYLNGTNIPEVSGSWNYLNGGVFCYYNNNPNYDTIYGKLYNYWALNDTLICPTNFHVPNWNEFNSLISYLGGPYDAVNKLKETGTSHWLSTSAAVNNSSGFTALPGGYRQYDNFFNIGVWATFGGSEYSKMIINHPSTPALATSWGGPTEGNSVRCIKNALPELGGITLEGINSSRVFASSAVSYDGGLQLTAKGFCIGTSPLPSLNSGMVITSDNTTTGTFNHEIRNLVPGTTYFIRAYATNGIGTNYGNESSFTTQSISATMVADIDGNLYSTIPWGNHRMLGTNLRTSRYNNDTSLGQFLNSNQASNLATLQKGAYFKYNTNYNDSLDGKLYNWYSINDTAICPTSWHIPSRQEWNNNSGNAANSFYYQGYFINYPYTYQSNLPNTPYYYWINEDYWVDYASTIGGGIFFKSTGMTIRCFNDTTPYQYQLTSYRNKQPGQVFLSARVNLDGGIPITSKGFCWSTSPNPTINNQSITVGSDTGYFQGYLSNLNHNTLYYIRPFATNSKGTSYGPQVSILTLKTGQVADYEGHGYDTVRIGNRTWLKQNLRTKFYRNGTPILQVQSNLNWGGIQSGVGAWAYYNNDSTLAATNGMVYNWFAVNDTAICPTGYRLPGDSDWNELILSLDPNACTTCQGIQSTIAGGMLKSVSPGTWNFPNSSANNSSGFNAIGTGSRNSSGQDSGLGLYGYWWSSSPISNGAWMRYVDYNSGSVNRNTNSWGVGYSIRCVNE